MNKLHINPSDEPICFTREGIYQLTAPPNQVVFSLRGKNYVETALRKRTPSSSLLTTQQRQQRRPMSASSSSFSSNNNNNKKKKKKKILRIRPSTATKTNRRRCQPSDGGLSIFKACQALDFPRVRSLLHQNIAKATDRNQYLQTPLHYVVRQSSLNKTDVAVQTECVKIGALLLQWSANMHAVK